MTRPKTRAIPTVPSDCPRSLLATIAPHPAKTSTNVAIASVSARGASPGLGKELLDELRHARVDLVPNPADCGDVLSGRVVEGPVLVALAREDRAGIAAPHRDHHVRSVDGLVG